MTTTDFPRRLNSPSIRLLHGSGAALVVAATAWLAAPAPSCAEPINYVFMDSSVALNGQSEQINGTFTYDPATTTESAVTIKLTGAAPYAATYTQLSPLMFTTSADLIDAFNGNITFEVIFRNDLGPTEDPIFAVNYTDPQANPPTIHVSGSGATGIVVPVVPEPSSLALLGVALGLFLLLPVPFRSAAQSHADHHKRGEARPIGATSPLGVCKSLIEDHPGDNYRAVYTVRFATRIYVLHAFQKKSKRGIARPRHELELIGERLKWVERLHNGKADETRV